MTVKFFEKLSNNYLELLDDNEDFNVIIKVGESYDAKAFQAHSAVLRYRSLYFRKELANANKDKNNIKTINLKHVSIQLFDIIIKYIYGGIISLENLDSSIIFELMLVACELLLEELVKYLEAYFIKEAHWLRLHFVLVYRKCFQNNMLQELQNWCNDIVVKYPNKVFDSEDFTSFQENVLISLIKRDDLQMEEVKIWNYVIEWGIAQNPGLPSDPKRWSNENFMTLRTTLQYCLPHIRYFQISGDDIYNYVKPYKQILEKALWNDIKIRLMALNQPVTSMVLPPRVILSQKLPNRSTEDFSKVISEAHAAEIASWVDSNNDIYSISDNPYEFKLLLRGSRDGFTAKSFWDLCNKKTNIIVVIKVKDTDEILGGYNPIGWEYSGNYKKKYCNDCFIFSLKNVSIKKSILSRKQGLDNAIYNDRGRLGFYYGLGIGENNWHCSDRIFSNMLNYRKIRDSSTYISNAIAVFSYFSVDEYEIFQIHKKV